MIRRLRTRATFQALSRAPRRRAGPLWVRFVQEADHEPARVGYAIGRRAGPAVVRNRIRRRLRAAVRIHEGALRPGGAYLLGADRTVLTMPYERLTEVVGTALRQADSA